MNYRPPVPGRRWSDGLHQAVEAKEGVKSSAKINARHHHFPNYFACTRTFWHDRYRETEAAEFSKIYNLDV